MGASTPARRLTLLVGATAALTIAAPATAPAQIGNAPRGAALSLATAGSAESAESTFERSYGGMSGSFEEGSANDDWFYDTYTAAGEPGEWPREGWFSQQKVYSGAHAGEIGEDDWFFDRYVEPVRGALDRPASEPLAAEAPTAGDEGEVRLSGAIERVKNVDVPGGGANLVARIRVADQEIALVDLGSAPAWKDEPMAIGTKLEATGIPARVEDRPVLFAGVATAGDETVTIERPARVRQALADRSAAARVASADDYGGEIAGLVLANKKVKVEPEDVIHSVILLEPGDAAPIVVDVGPVDDVQPARISRGGQLEVTGKPARIGSRLVLLADEVRFGAENVKQIDRDRQASAR